jgi:hypothetical protein
MQIFIRYRSLRRTKISSFKRKSLFQVDRGRPFQYASGLGYLGYAAASKERRGCLFLLYATSASYSLIKKAAFLIFRGLVGILDMQQPPSSVEAAPFFDMQHQPLTV